MPGTNAGKIAAEVLIRTESARKELESLQKLVDLSKKSLADLTKEALGGSTDGFEKHGKTVDKSSTAYRRFFQEQRLQDRILGEGKQAVLGMASALAFLSQGQDNESNQLKKLESGLTTFILTANAAEFALFSLGKMGASAGGSIGMVSQRIQSLAGPIGMVVGVGAGLIQFFEQANEKAENSQGIDTFKKRLEELSEKMLSIGTKQLREDLALQDDKIRKIKTQLEQAKEESGWKQKAADLNKILIDAESERENIVSRLNAANDLALEREKNKTTVFGEQRGLLKQINDEIAELTKQRDNEAQTEKEIAELNVRINRLIVEKNRLLKEQRDVFLKITESQYEDAWEYIREYYAKQAEAEREAENFRKRQAKDAVEMSKDINKQLMDDIHKRIKLEEEAEARKKEAVQQSMALLVEAFPEMKALAVAQAIVNTYLAAAAALAPPPVGAGPLFGPILAIATIANGLAQVAKITSTNPGYKTGGYTGEGNPNEVAGTVHRREIVFEESIVRNNKADLLAIRAALQQGATVSGIMATSGDNSIVALQISKLREDIKSLQLSTTIVMQGTLSGQTFLRKEMPKFAQHEKAKRT